MHRVFPSSGGSPFFANIFPGRREPLVQDRCNAVRVLQYFSLYASAMGLFHGVGSFFVFKIRIEHRYTVVLVVIASEKSSIV